MYQKGNRHPLGTHAVHAYDDQSHLHCRVSFNQSEGVQLIEILHHQTLIIWEECDPHETSLPLAQWRLVMDLRARPDGVS